MDLLFTPEAPVSLPIHNSDKRFPVHRVYCVGRNYAAHAKEMGMDGREPPFFFSKPVDALVHSAQAVTYVPYPPRTKDFHYEAELVIALADGGADITVSGAEQLIFGYGIGIDFTRRDVQNEMKKKGWPWDMAKGFDFSAPISQIYPKKDFGDPSKLDITLDVNEARKQHGKISDMIWNVHEVIAHLSTFVRLKAGDIIFTGTPEGVGPVLSSDLIVAKCGPAELQVKIA